MATANKVFVSPGVYTSERDLSFVAQSVGVTTLGLVGEAQQGPAFEPIFIGNFDEYQVYFGGTTPEKFVNTQIPKYEAAYIAKAYLQQSNQLFMTRVLGLNGYDAGPSWSISTVANVDKSTVGVTATSGPQTLSFSGAANGTVNITGIPAKLSSKFSESYLGPLGTTSSLETDFQTLILATLSDINSSGGTAYFWGTVSGSTFDSVTGTNANYSAYTENFGVDGITTDVADLTSTDDDYWYYGLFDNTAGSYAGYSFGAAYDTITDLGSGAYSGTMEVYYTDYSGTSFTDYDDVVVATLRSRGLTTDTSGGPVYTVSGTSDVTMVGTGVYVGVQTNPKLTFQISGITTDGNTFTFDTSFDSSNTNYIAKIFGKGNFSKDRTDVPLFLEEVLQTTLNDSYNKGYIRGLNTTLTALPQGRGLDSTSIAWYLNEYQTPRTPFVVSELRGNTVYRLFKFVLISDGSSANRQVKVSILNMQFSNNTFDVVVRDFFDTDENPVVLEKFTNCTMDPTQNGFVAQRIGTSNGEYDLKSKFIMVDMVEDAPVDALPCGFEGYNYRQYSGAKSPFPVYKTKYNTPGEVLYDPPLQGDANVVRSAGDRVRKVYLGFSSTVGIDPDFFEYKGKQAPTTSTGEGTDWSVLTKGFHMDSGATVVTISGAYSTSGTSAFDVGVAAFRNDPSSNTNPYFSLSARKFTLLAQGGFDGWDIYREYRTNGDTFSLGNTGFLAGNSSTSITYPDSTGWGYFKPITGPNQEQWANTDYYAYLWGQSTFANPEAVNINVFATPGIDFVNNASLVNDAIDMVETDRADSVYIATCPDYDLFSPTTSDFSTQFIYPEEIVNLLEDSGIDSNYTATYYPWILTRDTTNNTQIYLPPTAEVVRNLALTDNIAFPWFASAGYTRGLVNGVKARKKLTQDDRDILYKGRINPIATFSDVGTVIWGNKTLQVRESALDRINVRRLLLQARKLISAVAVRLLFEQNDETVRQQFLDSVNPILDSIRRDRGLIDFRVTVSNSPEDLDANQLVGKIYLKPTRALEFIDIEFLITPTGASFEDI